ncbi:MAG: glycosyltransferase [Halobacteriovoraceae bacterium]|jgi:glycosyltransferase involved in cell wall biosynthesis|nr:glycosyltransferase [Halobacteriovoraceae bacterium]
MDKSLPKVTIMVITYNQEDYVCEALDSILIQDYPNIEVVVADDASKDRTPEILKEYERKFPEIFKIILNKKNLGITGNSNIAFNASTGDFLVGLGGDDAFLPGKISAQVYEFQKDEKVVLCYHPVEIFDSETGEILHISNQSDSEDVSSARDIIEKGGIPGAASVMTRKSACPKEGFDPKIPCVSDWLYFIETALNGKIVKVDGVLGRYRKHSQGTSQKTYELLEESLRVMDRVVEKHPEHKWLESCCRKGKARYLMGEAFRQLEKMDLKTSSELATRASKLNKKSFFRAIALVCYLFFKLPLLAKILIPTLSKFKYTIRRISK